MSTSAIYERTLICQPWNEHLIRGIDRCERASARMIESGNHLCNTVENMIAEYNRV